MNKEIIVDVKFNDKSSFVLYEDYLKLLDLLCEAAPISWCSGRLNDHAEAWDKKVGVLLNKHLARKKRLSNILVNKI